MPYAGNELRARRIQYFVLAALAGVGAAVGVACSGSTSPSKDVASGCDGALCPVDGSAGIDANPELDAGTDAGPRTACPTPPSGDGDMVRVHADAGTFCVDTTEVTARAYSAFLAASGASTAEQAPECQGNTTFKPTCNYDPNANPTLPVVCVDWCDATAYCKWAGKRLCGNVGGGQAQPKSFLHDGGILRTEYYTACSSDNLPSRHGFGWDAGTCNDGRTNNTLQPVKTFPDCHGEDPAYAAVYDMVGNAAEWINDCPDGSLCAVFGFSYLADSYGGFANCMTYPPEAPTGSGRYYWPQRNETLPDVGFRCCAD